MSKRIDTPSRVRISDSARMNLLNQLDSNGHAEDGAVLEADRRVDPRLEYRTSDTPVAIEHPGGSVTRFLVCMRNLSAGGAAFIYGGYLHPGSNLTISLRQLDGQVQSIDGSIVGCRHAEGTYHEVRVKFTTRLDTALFIANG